MTNDELTMMDTANQPLLIGYSSFVIYPPSFVIRHSSFVISLAPLVVSP
jgi:hypothetical protein